MAEVELKFDSGSAQKFFAELWGNAKSVREMHDTYIRTISPIVFKDIIDHFKQEEGPTTRWHAWSAAYSKHMQRIGKGGNKILQDSGFLRQNVRATNFRKTSDGILFYNPAKTKGGFPYAAHHDETAGKPRSFMWLSQNVLSNIGELTLRFMLGKK